MIEFKGAPYPIVKNAKGFLANQGSLNQIKSGLLQLLLTNPGERCLTGETKIPLINEKECAIIDLVDREPFFVYSYDHKTQKVVHGKAIARKTAVNAEIIKVFLNNGESICCTPDHLFMLKNGCYIEANKLSKKDILMSFDKKLGLKTKRCRVKSIDRLNYKKDCYDLTVKDYHNFAISSGIFVHNCYLPTFGTPLRELLFEPNDQRLEQRAREMIINSIREWEPRITVEKVEVYSQVDNKSLSIDDKKENTENILLIRILYSDSQNISEIDELKLELPLGGVNA